MSILLNYLIAILTFVVIYLLGKLFLLWAKKKPLLPLVSYNLLVDAIAYTVLAFLFIGVLHIIFKNIDVLCLIVFDASLYLIINLAKPHQIFFAVKNKEKLSFKKNYVLASGVLLIILLECFVFNSKAYSGQKDTYQFDSFINERIESEGTIEKDKIIVSNKQCIYIQTNQNKYEDIYLHFESNDINLYVNIFEKTVGSEEYTFKKYVLIDPAIDAYGYISLDNMDLVSSLKIEFDIDSSRYFNNASKPLIAINKIAFDSYFPMIFNPLRVGGLIGLLFLGFNFKKIFISKKAEENDNFFNRLEKVVLFSGAIVFIGFIIYALINNSAYFIKYDELYLGGTSSNNIYYQQFVAYVKGQLHLDVPVDERLLTLTNPYNPSARSGITYLWDHAYYRGRYYSYYGHAPIYLVMLPVYWISHYVTSNVFVLQLGVIFSIFTYILAIIQIIKLFIKKINSHFVILTIIAMVVGSLLLNNNTYEYGGMVYRIPYAYANGFLFLTIYLFIKGYNDPKHRYPYFIFTGLSLVFIVFSRPIEIIYLLLLTPLIIKMILDNKNDKKTLLVDCLPGLSIIFFGAIIVCSLNYARFGNILEFGQHYQLTVMDCRSNNVDIDGVLPTIYHFFLQAPDYDKTNGLLIFREVKEKFEYHPYDISSVGLVFIPVALFMVLTPYVLRKEDSVPLKIFFIASPIVIFFVAFINYCFAGVCPRYLSDITPWACLAGGLVGLKAIEKDGGKHVVVPSLISAVLFISILITAQYHFVAFDGFRIGDCGGLLGYIKTIINQYNI